MNSSMSEGREVESRYTSYIVLYFKEDHGVREREILTHSRKHIHTLTHKVVNKERMGNDDGCKLEM